MNFENRWSIIEELDGGGQGKVYRVFDSNKFNINKSLFPLISKSIESWTSVQSDEQKKKEFESFRKGIIDLVKIEDPKNHGALKVLHIPENARDFERAEERIKNEIKAMNDISHANLIKILDYDPDEKWYVSKYYSNGTLTNNKEKFKGNFVKSLKAIKPLVGGVAELHKNKYIHRDIKPDNVFLDNDNNLILGDFGLIHFEDEEKTRISDTWENVGSRDWMPGWAQGKKINDLTPAFDVFALGKLLWAMVSNNPKLQLWYYNKTENDLEKTFPNAPFIEFANLLFEKCIVEEEKDCLPDAATLLDEIDKTLLKIQRNADIIKKDIERHCKICGVGRYTLVSDWDNDKTYLFGMRPPGNCRIGIFICNHCGHMQLFTNNEGRPFPAWSN